MATPIKKHGNIKTVHVEMRAYIKHQGRWCHVYILGSMDQLTIIGDPVRMLEYKTSKRSKTTYTAEKTKFFEKKPVLNNRKKEVEA